MLVRQLWPASPFPPLPPFHPLWPGTAAAVGWGETDHRCRPSTPACVRGGAAAQHRGCRPLHRSIWIMGIKTGDVQPLRWRPSAWLTTQRSRCGGPAGSCAVAGKTASDEVLLQFSNQPTHTKTASGGVPLELAGIPRCWRHTIVQPPGYQDTSKVDTSAPPASRYVARRASFPEHTAPTEVTTHIVAPRAARTPSFTVEAGSTGGVSSLVAAPRLSNGPVGGPRAALPR